MTQGLLDSHILEERRLIVLGKHPGPSFELVLHKYEALRALNSTLSIRAFAEDHDVRDGSTGVQYFANPVIAGFWRLYDSLAPDFKVVNPGAERAERQRFARRPFYVATVPQCAVVGGLWVDDVFKEKDGSSRAHIHIFAAAGHRNRGIGSLMLEFFEEDVAQKYNAVSCTWGAREACSPARLFRKHGYEVRELSGGNGGSALKYLKKPVGDGKSLEALAYQAQSL